MSFIMFFFHFSYHYVCISFFFFFFFFKQKTAYDMRISDWSSDVCSSDLAHMGADHSFQLLQRLAASRRDGRDGREVQLHRGAVDGEEQIGLAPIVERKSVV